MHLIRDVLDNQLVDGNQRRLGKVDGIVVQLREGEPPVVEFLESGWLTKARRVHPRLAAWLEGRLSRPYQIPWTRVRDVGVDLEVALDARQTPLLRLEDKLRRIIARIPGG